MKLLGSLVLGLAVVLATLLSRTEIVSAHDPGYTSSFMFDECEGFSSNDDNPFFSLEPGFRLVLEGEEDGEEIRVVITVLNKTKVITGVTTRVVEERETIDGELFEVSRNYYAICNRDNSVVYFGEDVDFYENGVIVGHDGAWRAGVNGAKPGIIMPGVQLLGARYMQEIAPGVALDRAETVSVTSDVETPAGSFKRCLKTKETTPLEPGVTFKFYAPDIGLVKDGVLELVEVSGDD